MRQNENNFNVASDCAPCIDAIICAMVGSIAALCIGIPGKSVGLIIGGALGTLGSAATLTTCGFFAYIGERSSVQNEENRPLLGETPPNPLTMSQ